MTKADVVWLRSLDIASLEYRISNINSQAIHYEKDSALIILIFPSSCYKDTGNYDYRDQ